MASRIFQRMWGLVFNQIIITGSFAPQGSGSSPTITQGRGWTVARTAAGVYTITFADVYPALVSFTTTLQYGTPAGDLTLVAGPWSQSASTISVSAFNATSALEIAANANNQIHFVACFRNSTVNPTGA